MNPTPAPYVYHAFERSYFSAKVRPALRYKKLWYEEVRADVRTILEKTGLGFIPMLETPEGEIWQDTSEMLDALEARHPEPPLVPQAPFARIAALLVELYVDEFGLIPAMHYRWGSERGEADARAAFAAMIGSAAIGNKAADAMVRARTAVGASDELGPEIEAHTADLLGAMCKHFEQYPYLLGDRMSLADCALMGPLYAHLYNDAVSRPLLLEGFPGIAAWIERCNHPNADAQGRWLSDEELVSALSPLLGLMGHDAVPAILASSEAIESWADAHEEERAEPPRGIGIASSQLRGKTLRQAIRPYTLWMVQRVLDAHRALESGERATVDAALEGTGWTPLLAYEPRYRAGKRDRKLTLEATRR